MSAAVVVSLEERFGPSDADREEWLAARRQGITATEMAQLMTGKTSMRDLALIKLGRKKDPFQANAYTEWGKAREPVIAELVRERYGVAPESRVVRAVDNPRKLASPDGVAVDFAGDLVLSEIKTGAARYDLAPGGADYAEKGYGFQIQWCHRVIGAKRTIYSWEGRQGAPGKFEPTPVQHAWVERDDELIARMDAVADEFLALLDQMAAEPFVEPDIDEHLDTLAVNVLRGRELEAEAKGLKEPAWKELQEKLTERGVPFSQESPLARITFTPGEPSESEVPDVEAAKAADPALFAEVQALSKRWNEHQAQYRKTEVKPGTAKLTVTQPKPPKR